MDNVIVFVEKVRVYICFNVLFYFGLVLFLWEDDFLRIGERKFKYIGGWGSICFKLGI